MAGVRQVNLLNDEDIEFLLNVLRGSPGPLTTQDLINALRERGK